MSHLIARKGRPARGSWVVVLLAAGIPLGCGSEPAETPVVSNANAAPAPAGARAAPTAVKKGLGAKPKFQRPAE